MAIPFYDSNTSEEDEIDGAYQPEVPAEQSFDSSTSGEDIEYEITSAEDEELFESVYPYLPDNMGQVPIDQWNVTGANGNQVIISLCQSLAAAMAEVIKQHYNAAVAVGHPFNTATVHVSPIDGLQFSFDFGEE